MMGSFGNVIRLRNKCPLETHCIIVLKSDLTELTGPDIDLYIWACFD